MVVYSSGAGVVPIGSHRHRKASLPMIAMHVDDILEFAWIPQYDISISIFPLRMHSDVRFMCMDTII